MERYLRNGHRLDLATEDIAAYMFDTAVRVFAHPENPTFLAQRRNLQRKVCVPTTKEETRLS